MKRNVSALLLSLFLLLTSVTLAEAPSEYVLPYEDGVLFDVFFLPGGDILCYGSFGRQAPDGRYGDTVVRSKPDGTEVWALDLPYPSNELGLASGILPLSDSRYMITHAMDEGDYRAFFIDADKGVTAEMQLPYGDQCYTAIDSGILEANPNLSEDSVRLRWLDLDGQEVCHRDYAVKSTRDLWLHLLNTDDAHYLLAQYYTLSQDTAYTLTKLNRDDLVQWVKMVALPHGYVYILQPDNEEGVLLIGNSGMYDDTIAYPHIASRIDANGNTVWEKKIDVDEWSIRRNTPTDDGLEMIWEKEDMIQFVTMDWNGELKKGPELVKSDLRIEGQEDAEWRMSWYGYAEDQAGRLWVYFQMIRELDMYHTDVKPFLRLLDVSVLHGDSE